MRKEGGRRSGVEGSFMNGRLSQEEISSEEEVLIKEGEARGSNNPIGLHCTQHSQGAWVFPELPHYDRPSVHEVHHTESSTLAAKG